jgi:hypothetical protein
MIEIEELQPDLDDHCQAVAAAAGLPQISQREYPRIAEALANIDSKEAAIAVCKVVGLIPTPIRVAAIEAVIDG